MRKRGLLLYNNFFVGNKLYQYILSTNCNEKICVYRQKKELKSFIKINSTADRFKVELI